MLNEYLIELMIRFLRIDLLNTHNKGSEASL